MILMSIVGLMRENQVWPGTLLYGFEYLLDLFATVRHEPISKFEELEFTEVLLSEEFRRMPRLILSDFKSAEYDPRDLAIRIVADQAEDGSSTSDLDIIRVRAKAKNRWGTIPFEVQLQIDHSFRTLSTCEGAR